MTPVRISKIASILELITDFTQPTAKAVLGNNPSKEA
jgi:hypothetical protein